MFNVITCTNCKQLITEPLCALCFENQVEAWINEQPILLDNKLSIKDKIKHFLKDILMFSTDINCVVCKKETCTLCCYCMMKETTSLLRSSLPSRKLLGNFKEIFNTQVYEFGMKH